MTVQISVFLREGDPLDIHPSSFVLGDRKVVMEFEEGYIFLDTQVALQASEKLRGVAEEILSASSEFTSTEEEL